MCYGKAITRQKTEERGEGNMKKKKAEGRGDGERNERNGEKGRLQRGGEWLYYFIDESSVENNAIFNNYNSH